MPLDEFEVEEEDEETQRLRARKQPVSVRSILAYIPILGWILNWIIGFFVRKINEVKRRRRSFKLALYFQVQIVLGLIGFLIFFIVAVEDISWLGNTSRVEAECSLPSSETLLNGTTVSLFNSAGTALDISSLYAAVTVNRKSISCTNENLFKVDAACTLSEFKNLLYLMVAVSVIFLIMAIIASIVFAGFNFFSNIPMEALDIDVTSCKVTFLSTACRHGPWLLHVLTLTSIAIVIALTILPAVTHSCLGSMSRTHACVNMYDDCVENQFRNCRYYFSANCVGENLPHSADQSSNFEECKDPVFASRFSGRLDARLVYPTPCSRCWALHADCGNAQITQLRLTKDKESSEFVYDTTRFDFSPAVPNSDLTMGRNIYCHCVAGRDKVGTATENAASLNFDVNRLTKNNTDCAALTGVSVCPTTPSGVVGTPAADPAADFWSPAWSDAVAGTEAAQLCSWGSSTVKAFFYEDTDCGQAGSTLNRYVFIVSYTTVTLMALFVIAGLSVRYTVQPETWSYSPQQKDEAWYWRVLRHVGPG